MRRDPLDRQDQQDLLDNLARLDSREDQGHRVSLDLLETPELLVLRVPLGLPGQVELPGLLGPLDQLVYQGQLEGLARPELPGLLVLQDQVVRLVQVE